MNKILKLTKVFLKTSFSRYQETSKKQTLSGKILKIVGIIILCIYLMAIFGFISFGMIDALNQVGQPALFLGLALLSVAILLIIQTLITSINLFYFAKDIEYILPFPLKPYEIVIAKFNTLIITEYVTVFIFMLAPFVIYGVLTGATILYYLYALLVLLIFPILPAIIACIIVMIAMCFSRLTKNKDKFQVIATIILILAVIFIQMNLTGQNETTNEQMIQMITQVNGLVEQIDDYFITLGDSINAITNYNNINGLLSLLKLIGITLIAYIVFIFLAQKLYLKGAVGAEYSGKKKKVKNKSGLNYKRQKIGFSYVKKELIILFKNPIFFTQCILPSALIPIIIIISVIASMGGTEQLNQLGTKDIEISNTVGMLIITGINVFLYVMNFISVTAISRDGENAVFMKYIPLSLSKQCTYKIVPAVIMNMLTIAIIITIAIVLFKVTILFAIISAIISILFSILYSYLMIIVDLKRPKLKWDTEYAVVKQNFNMIFEFALSIAIIILLIPIGFIMAKISYIITAILFAIILVAGIYLIRKYIDKNQLKLFEKIN